MNYIKIILYIIIQYSILSAQSDVRQFQRHLVYETDDNDYYIVYKGFVVYYDTLEKIPQYTIHSLIPAQIIPNGIPAKRSSNFFVDERVKNHSATNNDYKGSGYDRGHMVPAGDFYSDKELKNETFYLTNITPQNPSLNRGIWAGLESTIRQKILTLNTEAFIVTGSIITNHHEHIGSNVCVPNFLYKIIFIPSENQMFAFMFDNYINNYNRDISTYQVTVDDIEKIINRDFFEKLNDIEEDVVESTKMIWNDSDKR